MTLEKLFRIKYELLDRKEKSLKISDPILREAEAFRRGYDQAVEEFFREALHEVLENEAEEKRSA